MRFLFLFYVFFSQSAIASIAQGKVGWLGTLPKQLADLRTLDSPCAIRYELGQRSFICFSERTWRDAVKDPNWGCQATAQGVWKESSPLMSRRQDRVVIRTFLVSKWKSDSCGRVGGADVLVWIDGLRLSWSKRLAPGDSWGVFRKLILDQKTSALSAVPWRELGFVHVLTATGIHLYALAAAIDRVVLWCGRRLSVRQGKALARALSLMSWILLWLMSGARAGLLRPGWVVLLRWGASWSGHRIRRFAALGLSLCLDALAWIILPSVSERWEDFGLGRWHYALAVAGGCVGAELTRKRPVWQSHAAMAIVSWLAVVPLEILEHGWVAPLTPLLSVLTIPVLAQFALPGLCVLLLIGWESALTYFQQALLAGLGICVDLVRALDGLWLLPLPSVAAGAFVAVLFLLFRREGERIVVASLIPFAAIGFWVQPLEELLVQWNSGQGDAALAQFSDGQAWVLDTGSSKVVRPAFWLQRLAARNVGFVHQVVLSHMDEDHRGGLASLSAWIRIDRGVVRKEHLTEAWNRYPELQWTLPSESPSGWQWFAPPPLSAANGTMLGWSWKKGKALYLNLGDAPEALERRLEKHLHEHADATWFWKLSHHGSKTSTPEHWFRLFPVREAWVSAGHANQHGHPHSKVLRKIPSAVSIRVTSEEGDLIWRPH
jgi:beta-lactamase superfamily II metal-dependent hydrolase